MANKYLRHGETYCGDGTTSAAAASNGAAGAWNNINVFEGTAPAYGAAPAAGDTVYIRSKDNAGASITRTLAGNVTLGSSAANSTTAVSWVIDNGAVWSGIDGVLTYSCPGAFKVTLTDYNHYTALTQYALRIVEANSAASYKNYDMRASTLVGVLIDLSLSGTAGGYGGGVALASHMSACAIKLAYHPEAPLGCRSYVQHVLDALDIEATVANPGTAVFFAGGATESILVRGGRLHGAGTASGRQLVTAGLPASFVGFAVPVTVACNASSGALQSAVMADGVVGGHVAMSGGSASSRTDAYYPALAAQVPGNAAQLWSYLLDPAAASAHQLLSVGASKLFSDAAATRAIGVELLVSQAFVEVSAGTLWISVSYVDNASGAVKTLTTRHNDAAYTASSAPWSSTTYGAVLFDKRKLSVTTPTAIKSGTLVHVALTCAAKSTTTTRRIVMCPDFVIAAP